MSTSDETVMQRKDGESIVTWREYEALRDHLKRAIDSSADNLDGDIEAAKTQLGTTDATVNNIQTTVTDIQTNMTRLEATMNRLNNFMDTLQFEDAASMDGNEEVDPAQNQGRGRVFLAAAEASVLWVCRAHSVLSLTMMCLGSPSSQFPNFLAKM